MFPHSAEEAPLPFIVFHHNKHNYLVTVKCDVHVTLTLSATFNGRLTTERTASVSSASVRVWDRSLHSCVGFYTYSNQCDATFLFDCNTSSLHAQTRVKYSHINIVNNCVEAFHLVCLHWFRPCVFSIPKNRERRILPLHGGGAGLNLVTSSQRRSSTSLLPLCRLFVD